MMGHIYTIFGALFHTGLFVEGAQHIDLIHFLQDDWHYRLS